MVAAEAAAAALLDRARVVEEAGIAQVQPAFGHPQRAVAGHAGRQHGVEEVHAPMDGIEHVGRRAETHEVARPRGVGARGGPPRGGAGASPRASPPMHRPSKGSAAAKRVEAARRSASRPPWMMPKSAWSARAWARSERSAQRCVRSVASWTWARVEACGGTG